VTDVVMIGRLGPEALAAGTLGAHTMLLVLLFGLGVALAVQPLVAQARGARDVRGMRRTLRQGLWAGALMSVPVMLVCAGGTTLLLALGQAPATAAAAGGYLDAVLWGVPGAIAFMALRGFVAALDRAALALWVMLVGVLLNAGLNWLLIYGHLGFPRLELVGAGLATSLVNTAMALALAAIVLTDRRLRRYRVLGRFWRPDWARLRQVFAVGLPIGLTLMVEAGVFIAATVMMGWLGPIALAAHGIAIQVASVLFMVPLGLGLAVTVRVGLAHGAGDRTGVRRAGAVGYVAGLAVMAAATLLLVGAPHTLIALFLDLEAPGNTEVVALAVQLLAVAALFQLVDGAQVIGMNALRGLSDTRVPMLYAVLAYWGIGLAVALWLGFGLGLGGVGVWLGLAAGLAVAALLLGWRFHRLSRAAASRSTGAAPAYPLQS
jgi:MATE family multidrug resistance protein